MISMGQRSVFYWYDHLAARVCVCVCVRVCVRVRAHVPSVGLEDVIDHI